MQNNCFQFGFLKHLRWSRDLTTNGFLLHWSFPGAQWPPSLSNRRCLEHRADFSEMSAQLNWPTLRALGVTLAEPCQEWPQKQDALLEPILNFLGLNSKQQVWNLPLTCLMPQDGYVGVATCSVCVFVCVGGGSSAAGRWPLVRVDQIRAKYGRKTWSRRLGTQRSLSNRTVSTQQRQQERQFGMSTSMNENSEMWMSTCGSARELTQIKHLGKDPKMSPHMYMVPSKLTELDRICREHQNVSKSKCAKTEASN